MAAALRAARRGGAIGCSSAITGLGSTTVVAGLVKSPAVRVTVTGTVIGWNLARVKVALKPVSVASGIEQGVLQLGPIEVTTSAPGGIESNCTVTGVGAGRNESIEKDAQPARLSPTAVNTITLRMAYPSLCAANRNFHSNIEVQTIRRNHRGSGC
ncbi:hypothetical protein [Tardiphaga sp.]|uniref:hypothetical protein n=1 Tax=Tardiphaga sp. TaxID=1926292 RepID=UPI0019ABBE56|nr:hypothetical protein [Tardiphaga sp.]